ncbi:hypothetical protein B0H17DRAFT_1111747 [Mycena rosella]|uniref:Uncharacterized protein n=1 Tax=Mycena rosella TaxID=1033263 RepID=A0AAD7BL78_MYCRO|nr:hypothetical protein B0H17DRAFT_1111747 [Mycena rosella]
MRHRCAARARFGACVRALLALALWLPYLVLMLVRTSLRALFVVGGAYPCASARASFVLCPSSAHLSSVPRGPGPDSLLVRLVSPCRLVPPSPSNRPRIVSNRLKDHLLSSS